MSKEFRQRGFRCELLRDLRQLARSHDKATQHWNFNKAAGTWSTWSSERRGWHRTRVARWLYRKIKVRFCARDTHKSVSRNVEARCLAAVC